MPEVTSGPYCVYCRRYLSPSDVLPLQGKQKVQPVLRWHLGDHVGRCPRHLAKDAMPVVYVSGPANPH